MPARRRWFHHVLSIDNRRVATRREDLRRRIGSALAARVSPERTRAPTLTVRRLSWDWVVRLNRWLSLVGKLATAIWCAFIASVVLGFNWQDAVRSAFNSGRPIERAFALALIVPTLVFLVARSAIGFARWRLQRELWRRDVERLSSEAERRRSEEARAQ